MNPCRIFILRPIATMLLMVAIFISGLLAYRMLPQAALPQVDYPTIQVVTRYPGASPHVMATGVTAPLERQFGSMAGLANMFSTSSSTASIITLQFGLDVSLDSAVQYVQAAINAATNFLPPDLPSPPIYSKVNPADAPVLTLAVSSESLPLTQIEDLVETRLSQKISQVSGVGLVTIGGGQRPAIRISLNTVAMAAYGIGLDTLRSAIQASNSNQAKGSFDGPDLSIALDTNGQLLTAEQYKSQIIAVRNGVPIRLEDIAEVREGAEDQYLAAWSDGKPAILLNIQRQPGANVIQVVDRIKALLPDLEKSLPEVVDLSITADRTHSIRDSIRDVKFELVLAVSLVVMVILLFLRNLTATIIPSLAVPLSLVGTFSVMYLAGFSINNLTLMALTIATGFVVDDAIVMIENISRHLEGDMKGDAQDEDGKGLVRTVVSAVQAALNGSRQIAFTIISLTFSLIAVLIPLLFMGDLIGRLFREFAITLAIAILISAVVSLTLIPMLCAYLLKPSNTQKQGRFQQASERFFNRLVAFYGHHLKWVLAHQRLTLVVAVITLMATLLLTWITPKGFFPMQDNGLVQVFTEAPDSISFAAMSDRQQALSEILLKDSAVEHVTSVVGIDGINKTLNNGRLQITLKPRSERGSLDEVLTRIELDSQQVSGLRALFQPVQDITIETRSSPTQYQLVIGSPDTNMLDIWVPKIADALFQLPQIREVAVSSKPHGLKAYVEIDRDNASRLGVMLADVDEALYSAFGQRYASTIFTQINQYRVVLDTQPDLQQGLDALNSIYVSASDGRQVPLNTIARVIEVTDNLVIERENQFPASTVYFNIADGYALSDVIPEINRAIVGLNLPDEVQARFQGAASAYGSALNNELFLILAAMATMYIVLGILYESYLHPLTILSTLPSAGVGALLALILTAGELNVIAIIGIVLLIGIVQKNAIMMIDFALEAERTQNKLPQDAIYQACLLRFRPILMTTIAALFSAVPLAMGVGSGSELRQPLGIVMIGGLIFSQLLTLFTTPVIYLAFDRLGRMVDAWRNQDIKSTDKLMPEVTEK